MPTGKARGQGKYWIAVVFVFLIGVVLVVKFQRLLGRSLAKESFRTNIAWLSGNQVRLLGVSDKEVLVLTLPEKMVLPVVGMQSGLRSNVLKKFASSEKQPLIVVKRSLELLLGTVVDGVVESDKIPDKMVDGVKKDLLSFGVKTDLNPLERLLMYWKLGKLQVNQLKEISIPINLGVIEKLPDGTEVVNVDQSRLDLLVDDNLVNDQIMTDPVRISVINSSGVDKMGILAERLIKSAGGLVVDVKTGDVVDGWCRYKADKKTVTKNEGVVRWLELKLGCDRDKNEIDDENTILIELGRGFGAAYSR